MIDLNKSFARSARWNILESVIYQLIAVSHQFALFNVTPRATYGVIGSLFSLIYLLVTIVNFGLDATLGSFYLALVNNKKNFKKFIMLQLVPEYLFWISGLAVLFFIKVTWYPTLLSAYALDNLFLIIVGSIIILECTKKSLRTLLHLSLLHSHVATIEIATIVCYVSLVWSTYLIGSSITLYTAFIPMLATSVFSKLCYAGYAYKIYRSLPDGHEKVQPSSFLTRHFITHRFYNFLNQISHAAFSSNFLVPFYGALFGIEQAGILKLVSTIGHSISVITQKVFGISSSVIFSHIRQMELETKRAAFAMVTNSLNQFLYAVIIFFVINHHRFLQWGTASSQAITWTALSLFLIISFSENFFIIYEKFYINEQKSHYLFIFNLITICLLMMVIKHHVHLSQLGILVVIITIRLFSFIALALFSMRHWNLRTSFAIQPPYFIASLVFSLIFYCCTL